jgi:SAM-dependent methyltransferase
MTGGETFQYQGQELDLFAHAKHWKAYWASHVGKWIRGDVLEVGAGLGKNTLLLRNSSVLSWHCLEPDPAFETGLQAAIANLPRCSASRGTIRTVANRRFDSILYIDVLEHIQADHDELAMAASLLRPAGRLVVLSPAHEFLFSKFDASIGHYRRYNRKSLRACSPPHCQLAAMFYLDCAGVFLSLANRVLLGQSTPTLKQILAWDKYVVPISQLVDRVLGYRIGRTLVGVWVRHQMTSPAAH